MGGANDAVISYDVPQAVRATLARSERTEDIRFSPDNRRLALADFDRNLIAIIGVDITIGGLRPQVAVTDISEFSSAHLNGPHGVDFLDDETIIVVNRYADVAVFRLPKDNAAFDRGELTPIDPEPDRGFDLLAAPSAVAITSDAKGNIEVLICNNVSHTVTKHTLQADPLAVTVNDVVLRRRLDLPDGVAVSADNQWIAISNHDAHTVMLYERSRSLDASSDPDGILRGTFFPHGLRFSNDGRHLLVADAGAPHVHVYARDGKTWRGVRYPATFIRDMDDPVFALGLEHGGRENAGPKGIDIDRHGHVLATTSKFQPLAFFDVSSILHSSAERLPDDHALQVSYELDVQEASQEQVRISDARRAKLLASGSWRITSPLRRLKATWKRRR